jgi:uncharacterized spore protein YtfJ
MKKKHPKITNILLHEKVVGTCIDTVQIVTIPLNKSGFSNGDLLFNMTDKRYFISDTAGIGTNILAQQLLVLSDDVIQLGDWYLDDYNQIRKAVVAAEVKIYWDVREDYMKIISSYPQLEGTLPLSKETIQQWINNGTPRKGFVEMKEFEPETYGLNLDFQGNLILEFVPERKSAITVTPIVPTDEEIEEKVLEFKRYDLTIGSNPNIMFAGGYGFRIGYKQALKDLGYDN